MWGELIRKRFGWYSTLSLALLHCGLWSVFITSSFTYAAEPYAQIPLPEFKALINRVDKLQQREKLYIEKDKISSEKDRVQTDYIAKIEVANDTIQAYATKLEEHNARLEKQAGEKQLSTLAEGAGYGATAAAVIGVVIRKLILKF